MDTKEEMHTCGQCHKQVAAANLVLHEMHCKRFLCVCPECGESVPTEQLNQHKEEQHTQVKCSKCKKKVEHCQLIDHESNECVERLCECRFCELEVPWRQLDEHEQVCGSRTELCGDCGRYVTLRDQPEHGHTCPGDSNRSQAVSSRNIAPAATVTCHSCNEPLPADGAEEHKEKHEPEVNEYYSSRLRAVPRLSSTYKAISLPDTARRDDPDQILTCPHCHLALPLFTLRWHQVTLLHHMMRITYTWLKAFYYSNLKNCKK
uniref:TRAFD1/XAF1 zinc finger domain-containing protein n=1 Tax=Mola mola TaxID=94237 RepID=A0A3Q3WFE0_MOLML